MSCSSLALLRTYQAARVAVGVPWHTPVAGVWAELRVDSTRRAWEAAVLRLWRRVARLPRGRLAREAWEWAWAHKDSSVFVRRVRAAHVAVYGQEAPGAGRPTGVTAVWKAEMRKALRRRAVDDWGGYVGSRVWDGAGWYAGDQCDVPDAVGGIRTVQNALY